MDALSKVIYIMGPPGAGKGTQAKLLAEKIGYHQFSTGSAFRDVAAQDTELGRRVKETIDGGNLGPPQMAAEIVMVAVRKYIESGQGLIFDGTPRTVEEAAIVDDFFVKQKYGKPLVIFLAVDGEEMARRNIKRRYCLGITSDFPVVNKEDTQRCEELGGTVGVRPDDEPEKFAVRWEQFMSHTFPVVEKYRRQEIVHEVDGMKTVAKVHEQVMGVISSVTGN